jgi:SAM-dependent methyltransferase
MSNDAEARTREIVDAAAASGDPTAWFERLYADAAQGQAIVPWDWKIANPELVNWARAKQLVGHGRTAIVVGCGLGEDAELMASLGFETTAFDVSESGIRSAQARFPGSKVNYLTADLLDLPAEWRSAFDLVVEVFTVQALPPSLHARATGAVSSLVAPGGTLIVIATAGDDGSAEQQGPPWPLTRHEIEAFGGNGLEAVAIERNLAEMGPGNTWWRAEFRRPGDRGDSAAFS